MCVITCLLIYLWRSCEKIVATVDFSVSFNCNSFGIMRRQSAMRRLLMRCRTKPVYVAKHPAYIFVYFRVECVDRDFDEEIRSGSLVTNARFACILIEMVIFFSQMKWSGVASIFASPDYWCARAVHESRVQRFQKIYLW